MFKGLSAFPLTPMDTEGVVVVDEFQRLVSNLERTGVASVGILGSTGTYMFLSPNERKRAIAAAREVLSDLPLIVGVCAIRTDAATVLAQDAQTAGADGILMAPVSYNPLTEAEVAQHYETVANATDLPMCIYNNPGTTSFEFSRTLIERLSKLATVQAIKMPLPADGDFAAELATLPKNLAIGYSGDWGMADAFLAGAKAFYSSIAGTLPGPLVALANAALEDDVKTARKLDAKLIPLWDLCKQKGSLRVASALAQEMGLVSSNLPRPLLDLTGADRVTVQEILRTI